MRHLDFSPCAIAIRCHTHAEELHHLMTSLRATLALDTLVAMQASPRQHRIIFNLADLDQPN